MSAETFATDGVEQASFTERVTMDMAAVGRPVEKIPHRQIEGDNG